MSLFHAVGVGPLNLDISFEIPPEKFGLLNRDLENKGSTPFLYCGEGLGKPEEVETTIKTLEEHAKPTGEGPGGSAANTIRTLGKMGFSTGFFGMVGSDVYREKILRSFKNCGTNTDRILVERDGSGVCLSVADIDRSLMMYPNSNNLLNLTHLHDNGVLSEYLGESSFVHMSSFACSHEDGPFKVQKEIAEKLGKRVKISFSPGELYAGLDKALEKLEPILRNTHVLFLNRREMHKLGYHYMDGATRLLELGPQFVVCTLSMEGAFLAYRSDDGETRTYEARNATDPKDVKVRYLTCARDYFAAGFLAGLLQGKKPEECAILGNDIAGYWLKGLEIPRLIR